MLVLTAALVAPWFVDWTSYRADFEREASRVLGRTVNVRGRAEARLIPFPSLTFTDVTVAGDGGEPAMTVDRFSMDAELAPFLRGEVLIFDMRLERPKVRLAINADGAMDWAIRPEAPAGLSQVSLENLSVSDGELIVDHAASDGRYRISSIFAEMSARSLAGPWRFNGAMKANGQLVAVDASTGEAGPDGRMRLHLTIEPARQKVKIEAEGGAYLDAARPRYAGTFTVTPRKETGEADPAFTITVKDETISRLTGEFSLDHKLLAFDALRYESGQKADPYVAEGTGFIDLGEEPHFAVNMEGRQISLDEGGQGGGSVAWDEQIAQAQALLDAIPQPAIPGTVDLKLPAVMAGGTTLRDIEISAEPIADGWLLHRLSAGLPGRSTLEADGALTVADGIAFNGNILLAVAQPSGLATWLTGEASEAVRRLGAAGFSGKADLSQDRQRLTGLELALGGETLTGSFERTSSGKSSPSLSLRLEGGALDGDRVEALTHVFLGPEGGYRFGEESLDLTLKAGPVTWQGFKAGSVDLALRARGDRIDVDRLSLRDLAGADVSATGVSSGTGSARKTNSDISVIGTDLAPLAGLLAERFPQSALAQGLADRAGLYPGLLADSNIDIAMAVEVKDGAFPATLSTRGVAGGTEFEADYATPDAMAGFAGGKLSVKASNSDAAPVFAAYGLPALPLGLGGEVATGLQLAGRDDGAITAALTLTGPERAFAINGVWMRPTGGNPGFEGEAVLSGKDLSPWLYALGIGFPGIELGLAADLNSPVRWDGTAVLLPELAGRIEDVTVLADLAATAGAERPMLKGKLETDAFDGGLLAGLLWGVGAATLPEGDIPWSDEAIAARDSYPADLDLALIAEKLGIGAGIDIGGASGQLSVGGGKARLSVFAGEVLGGRIEGSAELSNVDGAGLLSVQGRLIDTDMEQLLPGRDLAGRADIAASLSGSGKSQAAIASSLAGSGVVDLRALGIDGLAPDPLPGVLADADAAGRDATQADFDRIIRTHALTGAFEARTGAFAFTVAGGVARSAPFALADRLARIDAKVSADIGARRTAGEAAVTWEAGDNAVAGSVPQIGISWPSDSDGVLVDTAAMTQFLTQRALEAEQARVQAMQSALMEKQRLRREVRLYAVLEAERQRKAEEEARLKAEEEARRLAEEERRLAEEEAQRKAEEEARRKAEDAARQGVRDLQPENGGSNGLPLPSDPGSGAVPIQ